MHTLILIFMVPNIFGDVERVCTPVLTVFLNTIRKQTNLFPHTPLRQKNQKHIDASCWCLQPLGMLLTVSNSGSNFQVPRELQKQREWLISFLVSKRENTSSSKVLWLFMDICRVQFYSHVGLCHNILESKLVTYSIWISREDTFMLYFMFLKSMGRPACELCHWWKIFANFLQKNYGTDYS